MQCNCNSLQVVLFQKHSFLYQIYLPFFKILHSEMNIGNHYTCSLFSRVRINRKCYSNFWLNWCKNKCFWKRTTCNLDNRIFVVEFFYDDRIYFLPHSSRFMTDFRIELFLEFPWNLGYIHKTFLSGTYFNRTFVVGFNSYDERIFILTTTFLMIYDCFSMIKEFLEFWKFRLNIIKVIPIIHLMI